MQRYRGKHGGGGEGKHEMETQWDAAAEDKGREAAAASHGVSITAGQPKLTESTLTPF